MVLDRRPPIRTSGTAPRERDTLCLGIKGSLVDRFLAFPDSDGFFEVSEDSAGALHLRPRGSDGQPSCEVFLR